MSTPKKSERAHMRNERALPEFGVSSINLPLTLGVEGTFLLHEPHDTLHMQPETAEAVEDRIPSVEEKL